jgi:hypothetical protein
MAVARCSLVSSGRGTMRLITFKQKSLELAPAPTPITCFKHSNSSWALLRIFSGTEMTTVSLMRGKTGDKRP